MKNIHLTLIAAAAMLFCSCKEFNPPTPACTKCQDTLSFSDAVVSDSVHSALNEPDECGVCTAFIPKVTTLTINTSANSLSDISKLTSLRVLIINNNTLPAFPQGLTTLPITSMSFNNTVLGDINGAASLPNLATLQLTGCTIVTSPVIYGASRLSRLVVSGTMVGIPQITSLTWLTGMNWLTYVDVSNDGLINIDAAATLGGATNFIAAHNSIVSITAVASMTNLKYLDLSYNNITDISPLVTNALTPNNGFSKNGGGYVDLRNNQLSANSINVEIPQLTAQHITVLY